jgi:putative transposase
LPERARRLAAWNRPLASAIVTILARAVLGDYRRRAKRQGILGHSGSVTVIQRFSQTLRLCVHYHLVAIDGVYQESADGAAFHRLEAPSQKDIERLTRRIHDRIERELQKRGLSSDATDYETPSDDLAEREPALTAITQASLAGTIATGKRRGQTVMRMGIADEPDEHERKVRARARLCADIVGYNLHAGVRIAAHDAQGRERLLRYLLRGPLALDRLHEMDGGRIALTLRKPLSDGTTHLVFDPLEFIEKLIALIPAPRAHQIRYHGLLAPHAHLRPHIVSKPADPTVASDAAAAHDTDLAGSRRKRWAQLLAHVFQIDILECPHCHSRMKVIAVIKRRESLIPILEYLDLPTQPPTPAPARAPPQAQLFPGGSVTSASTATTEHADPPFCDEPA